MTICVAVGGIATNCGHEDDLEFAVASLSDGAAARRLRESFHPLLVRTLAMRGASQCEAEDLVADLWSDCFGATHAGRPLLARYQGRSSLQAWLLTVAMNRLVDFKRRERFRDVFHDREGGNSMDAMPAATGDEGPDALLLGMIHGALKTGFAACDPEGIVMLKLVHVHEISQREIARMWGWHESKVSRALDGWMRKIEDGTLEAMKRSDPWLELRWGDLLQMCESMPAPF